MISAQLGTEFSDSEYDNIKKVYSIWVCMHSPQKIGNAISHYHMEKEDLLPGLPDIPKSYDKLSVIIIALNERVSSDDKFINMMNTLLSTQKTYQEKRSALENTYHISMSYNLGKELGKMDHVLDDVIEQKLAEGLAEGQNKAKKELITNLLRNEKRILQEIAFRKISIFPICISCNILFFYIFLIFTRIYTSAQTALPAHTSAS